MNIFFNSLTLSGCWSAMFVGLVEVLVQVVELEHLVVERVGIGGAEGLPGRAVDLGAQQPALVVERPLAHHLEVLGLVARRRLGVLLSKV
jgi:hypothetical protein